MNEERNYRIELIDSEILLNSKEEEWLKFEKSISDVHICNSYFYIKLLWDNYKNTNLIKEFGIKRQLLILFLYKNEKLLAIFPFCRITRKRKKVFNVNTIEFIGQQKIYDYSDIITNGIDKEEFDIVYKWLKTNIRFDLIHLSHIPDFSKNKLHIYQNGLYPFSHSAEIHLRDIKDYNHYRTEIYTSNFKQTIRTLNNRLKKAGLHPVVIYKKFDDNDIHALQKLADYKLERGKSNIYNSENINFLKGIYKEFDAHIYFVQIESKTVAYLVKLKYLNWSFWFDISFHSDYKKFWLGTFMFDYCLQDSFDLNEKEIHLGWGVDFIKYRFCNRFVEISNCILFGNTLLNKIWYYEKKRQIVSASKIFLETIHKSKFIKNTH